MTHLGHTNWTRTYGEEKFKGNDQTQGLVENSQ